MAGRRGAGPARLRQTLLDRGLPPDVVAAVAAECFAEGEEGEVAVAVARRRLPALRGLAPDVARRRLAGYLSRRGHGADAIAHALRALLGQAGDELEGD